MCIRDRVYAAKENVRAADDLIRSYLPFIKAETAKFLKRPPIEGQDDELSIAMMAFHEAIGGYSRTRGSFLKYAAMLIRSRLVAVSYTHLGVYKRQTEHFNTLQFDELYGYLLHQSKREGDALLLENGLRIFPGMETDIAEGGHILSLGTVETILELNQRLAPHKQPGHFLPFEKLLDLFREYDCLLYTSRCV